MHECRGSRGVRSTFHSPLDRHDAARYATPHEENGGRPKTLARTRRAAVAARHPRLRARPPAASQADGRPYIHAARAFRARFVADPARRALGCADGWMGNLLRRWASRSRHAFPTSRLLPSPCALDSTRSNIPPTGSRHCAARSASPPARATPARSSTRRLNILYRTRTAAAFSMWGRHSIIFPRASSPPCSRPRNPNLLWWPEARRGSRRASAISALMEKSPTRRKPGMRRRSFAQCRSQRRWTVGRTTMRDAL